MRWISASAMTTFTKAGLLLGIRNIVRTWVICCGINGVTGSSAEIATVVRRFGEENTEESLG